MKRLFSFATYGLLSLVATILLAAGPAFAQAAPAASDVTGTILGIIVASAPGLVLGAWALFKAHAANSAAKWDDEAVAFVEKIAAGVVEKKTASVTGTDH